MINIKNIRAISTVLLLLVFSTCLSAEEPGPQAAGSWMSILPPLLAIVFALTLKKVIPALFLGIWLGTWIINDFGIGGLWIGLLETFQVYILNALADSDRAAIVLFSLMIGGMVGIISRNGGMQGVVNRIAQWADSVRRASLATAVMGLAIFFDDYTNTLVVGNTMRPVTDDKRISRAKLAYIVDSTAAPVACLALVSTWIGYEVGLISEASEKLAGFNMDAYLVFLNTIPYSFYPILAIIFVFMIAYSGRDFGPMLDAERQAREKGVFLDDHLSDESENDCRPIEAVTGKPHRALNAVIPVAILVFTVVAGLYITGKSALDSSNPSLQDIIGAADSIKSLLWGSFLGMLSATFLTLTQRILDLEDTINAWYLGLRSMLMALIILLLAWSLGDISELLGTADFLVNTLGDSLPPYVLPLLIFALAAGTAFATGSSWGAMAILVPLVIPLSWAILGTRDMQSPEHMHILYSSISAVLAGSVWGDHCSPISDTTILSSLASGCDHIEHVRTQLPYAVLVGLVSLLAGTLPVAMGIPWWLGLGGGIAILWVLLRLLGRQSEPGAS